MSDKRNAVFTSIEDAKMNVPANDKFRLYVAEMDGSKLYVWERNPMMAIGRVADHIGHKAIPAEGSVTAGKAAPVKKAAKAFTKLTAEERAELLAELQGLPPAPPRDVTETTPTDETTSETPAKGKGKGKGKK